MPQAKVLQEEYGFSPTALIELWELNGTAIGMNTIYHFVDGSTSSYQPIVFNGVQYAPMPIKVEKMEVDGKSSLPRPTLTVANINGFVSNLLLSNGSTLDGATVTRTRVRARFIDAVNFQGTNVPTWNSPDPTATLAPEPFMINRRVTENREIVAWELASPLEMNNARLPRQQIIANSCSYHYRQVGTCNYSGPPVADSSNRTFTGTFYNMTLTDKGNYNGGTTYARGDYVTTFSTIPQFATIPVVWVCAVGGTVGVTPSSSTSNWINDQCSKSSAGCALRFPGQPLRTSAFPGVARAGWISRS